MKVAICGTQGGGKSTLVKNLSSNFPELWEHYDEPVRFIIEYINNFTLYNAGISISLNNGACDFAQLTFLHYYNSLMHSKYDESTNHVFDRCAFDVMVFWQNRFINKETNKFCIDNNNPEQNFMLDLLPHSVSRVRDVLLNTLNFFDHIIFLESGAFKLLDDGVRDISPEYLRSIGDRFYDMYLQLHDRSIIKNLGFNEGDVVNYPKITYISKEEIINNPPLHEYINNKLILNN